MSAGHWDDRYAADEYVWRSDPNVFVAAEAGDLPAGRALDLACGEGRNAVWLAGRGWDVTGVDFSAVGLDKARRMAADAGVVVDWITADVTTWTPPEVGFDLVLVCYLQVSERARQLALGVAGRALAPGGTILVVAHDSANLADGTGGPQDPDVLYSPLEVVADLRAVGVDLVVEKAATVERTVAGADRPALDCLVRAQVARTGGG